MIRQKDKKDTVACVLKIEKSYNFISYVHPKNVRGPESTFDPAPRPCVIEFFLDIFQLHVIHVIY